jgi:RNA polymerase sigma-70 factor (ECF subfamily)
VTHEHGTGRCREMFEKLSEYLDGELDAGLCDRVDLHLDGCEPCQAYLESLRRTVRLVGSLETPALDEETRRRLLENYQRLRDQVSGGDPAAD